MMTLAMQLAEDSRIRAVGMNGSRVNQNAPRDCFQDFDIAFLVDDLEYFTANDDWLLPFGEILILQKPDISSLFLQEDAWRYGVLVQFADGNRIDFAFISVRDAWRYREDDRLTVILLDKDGLFPDMPPPSDTDYHIKRPTAQNVLDCANEFWWTSVYVVKGLWRRELLYANWHMDQCVRYELLRMLEWRTGLKTDFTVSAGKCRKYLPSYLTEQECSALMQTYRCDSIESCWQALFTAAELFRAISEKLAGQLEVKLPEGESARVIDYLKHIFTLSAEAVEI